MWSRPATGEPAGSRPVIVVCGRNQLCRRCGSARAPPRNRSPKGVTGRPNCGPSLVRGKGHMVTLQERADSCRVIAGDLSRRFHMLAGRPVRFGRFDGICCPGGTGRWRVPLATPHQVP